MPKGQRSAAGEVSGVTMRWEERCGEREMVNDRLKREELGALEEDNM